MNPIEWLICEEWGRLGVRNLEGLAFVHCDITRWSPSLRKACIARWEEFKEAMRARGFTGLYSMVPEGDAKVRKWQELFGQRLVSTLDGCCLYRQEI